MKRHKMSLDIEYVKDWSIQDAIRELMQNAIDHENWCWEYKNLDLIITSKDVELTVRSLLLGHSKKLEGKIGKFGEGYKLAMLVLTRLGYKCEIHTGNNVWLPKIINSKTYGTKQLVFDITEAALSTEHTSFIIHGIEPEVFHSIDNLHVTPVSEPYWTTQFGDILQESYAGKIYVNGLYISTIKELHHGYNIKPAHLTLDRDRRLVRDFDIQWLSCQMWKETNEFDYILALIKAQAADVKYLDSFTYSTAQGLADKAAEEFIDAHGLEAVPVVDQYDVEKAKEEGHDNIIIVPKVTVQLLNQSILWTRPAPKIIKKRPREILMDFFTQYSAEMTEAARLDYMTLLDTAEDWSN